MKTNPIRMSALCLAAALGTAALAQAPAPPEAKPEQKAETKADAPTREAPKGDAKADGAKAPSAGPLGPLAWLEGCWRGAVNRREFREHWLPLRGNVLIGASHIVMEEKTLGFEYLRIESRPDGIYYVAAPTGKQESAFRLTERSVDRAEGRNDEIFVFANPALEFPQKISYRRASEGWLYAAVSGKSAGKDREVIYPMRRVDCESGEFIRR